MNAKRLNKTYLADYIFFIQSKGRYSITLDELKQELDVSEKALLQSLYRLKAKNKIAQIRKEFYVIIPPQYARTGMLSPVLFIDDMMKFLEKPYYVGLFSAAAMHGAGHQQPMGFQVITKKPALRRIKKNNLSISFFTKSSWQVNEIMEKKTEAGYINVSTPELTAFDLVFYSKRIGGINRLIPILEDLVEEMKPSTLSRIARQQSITTIQRLGYLLDELNCEKLSDSLWKLINNRKVKKIPLSLGYKTRTGPLNRKWNVIINSKIDF